MQNSQTCRYAFNTDDFSVVDCSNEGSDIPSPTGDGQHILKIEGTDSSNNVAVTQVSFTLNSIAPIISDVRITNKGSSAVINWFTNEPTDSNLLYGKSDVSEYSVTIQNKTPFSVPIENLDRCSVYVFQIVATDSAGNVSTSTIQNFKTTNCTTQIGYINRSPVSPTQENSMILTSDQIRDLIARYVSSTTNNLSNAVVTHDAFTRDLEINMEGEDVRSLQRNLNSLGYVISATGPGSIGNETTFFGRLTHQALIEYQKANAISPPIGYFGPITRLKMFGE